jgi:hypothetical protein
MVVIELAGCIGALLIARRLVVPRVLVRTRWARLPCDTEFDSGWLLLQFAIDRGCEVGQ